MVRLDYCSYLFVGVFQSNLSRLQLVQNAAVRLLTGTRKREHISPTPYLQYGAGAFGCRSGTSAQIVLLFTFLHSLAFSFYTHDVCTDHLSLQYTVLHILFYCTFYSIF